MNMNQVEYAIALAEYKKFSEVSKRLYVAQSSISKQICLLEEEVGFPLFERLKSGTELTPEGKIMIEAFRAGRDGINSAVDRARYLQNCGGMLKIGVSAGFESFPVLLHSLESLRRLHPSLEIGIQSFHYADLAAEFNRDRLDMVIDCDTEFPGRNWERLPLWEEKYALIVPQDHPLANGVAVKDYDFSGDVLWFARHEDSDAYKSLIQNICELLRADDSMIRYARDLDSLMACMEAGLGLMVAPWIRRLGNEGFCRIPLESKKLPVLRMEAIWKKKNPNPALADFVSLMRETVMEMGALNR